MAAHLREQILAAITTAVTGLATAGANVFQDRDTEERPLVATELPALTVDDDGESAAITTLGIGRVLERRLRVRLTAHVRQASAPGTQLNAMLKEVEVALAGASLAGAKSATIAEVGEREKTEGGEVRAVRQSFTFEVLYYTAHTAPDVAL